MTAPPYRRSTYIRGLGWVVVSLAALSCGDRASGPRATAASVETPPPAEAPTPAIDGPMQLQRSLQLERDGDLPGATEAAQRAVEAGQGRAATLQLAKLHILQHRPAKAEPLLQRLIADNDGDAHAHYNLGYIAHQDGRYNAARSGYIAALRANPQLADARYNLALLTWGRGAAEEARHHAERFAEAWPEDPRATELAALVALP